MRVLAPVVLLGAVTSACMNVTVQVDTAPPTSVEPTGYYGTVETARWPARHADDRTYDTYETWGDCWAS